MALLFARSLRSITADARTVMRIGLKTSAPANHFNTFNFFVKTNFDVLKSKNPSLKNSDIFRKLGEAYRGLSPEEKEKIKESYQENVAQPPETNSYSEKKKMLMYAHRFGMPRKPPMSGFNVFIQESLSDMKGQPISKAALKFAEAAKQWNSLPSSEQSIYAIKSQDLRASYEEELQYWAKENEVLYSKNLTTLITRFYRRSRSHKKATATAAKRLASETTESEQQPPSLVDGA